MSRSYDLTEDEEPIQGMFWFKGEEESPFQGVLHLEAGKKPRLETAKFNYEGWNNIFPGSSQKKPIKLHGEEVTIAMRNRSRELIFGHDEHGKKITLVKAYSSSTQSTFALQSFSYTMRAAIFGAHIDVEKELFKSIRLRVDHLDDWVGRCAFQHYGSTYDDAEDGKKLSKITIPFARDQNIPLTLADYKESSFFCACRMSLPSSQRFTLEGKVYFDLEFKSAVSWLDLLDEVHKWEWFFSLATRDTINLSYLEVTPERNDTEQESEFPEGCNVWLPRSDGAKPLRPKRTSHDFHFTYNDVESVFPAVVEKWKSMQSPWAAVLHRFFSICGPRDIWVNEKFLFLAQAIESMHRAKTGAPSDGVDLNQASKHAWENSPVELQDLIGRKKVFQDQLRKSRNYWTHYRESDDPDVLRSRDLIYFLMKSSGGL